mmetsp:Transcript_18101/g.53621  ORF Transcript_18101/g.53621 Transcript_18101/m.53621 type:complete len:212 (+) Transcript_18101:941-1576(+)
MSFGMPSNMPGRRAPRALARRSSASSTTIFLKRPSGSVVSALLFSSRNTIELSVENAWLSIDVIRLLSRYRYFMCRSPAKSVAEMLPIWLCESQTCTTVVGMSVGTEVSVPPVCEPEQSSTSDDGPITTHPASAYVTAVAEGTRAAAAAARATVRSMSASERRSARRRSERLRSLHAGSRRFHESAGLARLYHPNHTLSRRVWPRPRLVSP